MEKIIAHYDGSEMYLIYSVEGKQICTLHRAPVKDLESMKIQMADFGMEIADKLECPKAESPNTKGLTLLKKYIAEAKKR